ncbi:hypothetical protein [Chitinophaga rhizosphaerae]|uniref:hypothetical protein n=1 Tax=Chitinophaga rhizosphaerae TaxID=1864947 RepID=UPI000F7FB52E|nr:hypothetical protein [Chitinophaga rhizosphaerae]
MRTLENFRKNDYMRAMLHIIDGDRSLPLLIVHDLLATDAYYNTLQNLQVLEKSETVVLNGIKRYSSVLMWYLAVDSYMDKILQICSQIYGQDYENLVSHKIQHKPKLIADLLSLDQKGFPLEVLSEKLSAFDVLHQQMTGCSKQKAALSSTYSFSNGIYAINQSDGIQAMLIASEVFELFRNCIPGVDIMPSVEVYMWPEIYFEFVDVLVKKIMIPSISDILSKLQITSDIDLSTDFKRFKPSLNVGRYRFSLSRVTMQHSNFSLPKNLPATQIVEGFEEEYMKKHTK